jgi:hydroxymethyl cephem carbamoyltransferase
MLVMGMKPAHDGAVAVLQDRKLIFSLESEKDSCERHSELTPTTLIDIAERLPELPDIVAIGGWHKRRMLGQPHIGAGYSGANALAEWSSTFFGKKVTVFTSSHERSHIAMAAGMAPRDGADLRSLLVWEGATGSIYVLDRAGALLQDIPVLSEPGGRYAFLFALADPTFPDTGAIPRLEDSGKLMALAAYGNGGDADRPITETVARIFEVPSFYPAPKHEFADSPLYNAGVEADAVKTAAALLTDRIFDVYAKAAVEHLPPGSPLYISGGCGLNCDWNRRWRDLGHFSSVFVPPCTNDSGSALGTAMDALGAVTGDYFIEWDVYCGLEFDHDREPDPTIWRRQRLDNGAVAEALAAGRIFAWVQGRWEMGPRALGNRSILAEPFNVATHDRLNEIKRREGYRPIAPCCRIEDVGEAFVEDFPDPYMLYFRRVRRPDLGAITHVDGSARVQTVTADSNTPLHDLLTAFAERTGVGVLCNTSLNFKGLGFINRMSDLVEYCGRRGLDDFVVGDAWFSRSSA